MIKRNIAKFICYILVIILATLFLIVGIKIKSLSYLFFSCVYSLIILIVDRYLSKKRG